MSLNCTPERHEKNGIIPAVHVYLVERTDDTILTFCRGDHNTRMTKHLLDQAKRDHKEAWRSGAKSFYVSIQEEPFRAILDHSLTSRYGMSKVFLARRCLICQQPLTNKQLLLVLESGEASYCSTYCKRLHQRWLTGK